ncbi:unnamed protein product [Cochlearia groenlandica]
MKRLCTSRSFLIALFLILLAFFSRKFHIQGHRDLHISKKSLRGEKDSLRRIPRSRYSPIQNKRGPSRKQKIITSREP